MSDMILVKCANPNEKCFLCKECKRNAPVEEDEDMEEFPIQNARMTGWDCSGYVSMRQSKGLFDE